MIGWLILIAAIALIASIIWASMRFARYRRIAQRRTETAGELQRTMRMLGLSEVRESQLFQSRVFTLRGELNGFRIDCELWDHSQDPFCRVTIAYPRPLRQGMRMFPAREGRLFGGLTGAARGESATTISNGLVVTAHENAERLRSFLDGDIQHHVERLNERVDDLFVGDERLFLYAEGPLAEQNCEALIRDGMAIAASLYSRAMALGPSRKSRVGTYAQVETEMFNRSSLEMSLDPPISEHGRSRTGEISQSGSSPPA
ncbi:MAG: hypothetical protein H0U74_19815 [Bradymonadaceae bacterium]|nr:hypothetical protein [Lujinxingiaceae bacterium]